LGDLRDCEERVEDAVRSWRKAFDLAPSDRLREKIFKAERDLQASRDYDFATTSHFNMRFDGEVDLDGIYEINAANENKTKLDANTFVQVFELGQNGDRLQRVEFHTSCSKDLDIGDQFGSVLIEGYQAEQ